MGEETLIDFEQKRWSEADRDNGGGAAARLNMVTAAGELSGAPSSSAASSGLSPDALVGGDTDPQVARALGEAALKEGARAAAAAEARRAAVRKRLEQKKAAKRGLKSKRS